MNHGDVTPGFEYRCNATASWRLFASRGWAVLEMMRRGTGVPAGCCRNSAATAVRPAPPTATNAWPPMPTPLAAVRRWPQIDGSRIRSAASRVAVWWRWSLAAPFGRWVPSTRRRRLVRCRARHAAGRYTRTALPVRRSASRRGGSTATMTSAERGPDPQLVQSISRGRQRRTDYVLGRARRRPRSDHAPGVLGTPCARYPVACSADSHQAARQGNGGLILRRPSNGIRHDPCCRHHHRQTRHAR